MSTVSGAVFDHKSETPGLGAEISLEWFQKPFVGKQIFDGDEFTSIKVVKGGAQENDMHGVDAISGGTITSDGVTEMLNERLSNYIPFLLSRMSQQSELINDSTSLPNTLTSDTLNTIL
jgi:Na+-transporting NADH:ubiquinone oxidoreductase subunit C